MHIITLFELLDYRYTHFVFYKNAQISAKPQDSYQITGFEYGHLFWVLNDSYKIISDF